jgi:hypothetical protein
VRRSTFTPGGWSRSAAWRLKDIRVMGDAVIAAFFAENKSKAREKKRAEVESWLGGSPVAWDKMAVMAATLNRDQYLLAPFHWEVEFPEVFARANGGFDAKFSISRFATQLWDPALFSSKHVARLASGWCGLGHGGPKHDQRSRRMYGVDKNPLATDLAKLSLWLATLARDHEFTFLDHALKSGDSGFFHRKRSCFASRSFLDLL